MARAFASLLLPLGALAQPGCSGQTGILLEVTRTDRVPAELDTLSFVVGVAEDGLYVQDEGGSPDDVSVEGQDLMSDPYRLLLRDGVAGPGRTTVSVAVLAWADGEIAGFAGLTQPLAFASGKVLSQPVTLDASGAFRLSGTGCVQWLVGEEVVSIGSPDDQDCDGDVTAEDCDDRNPTVGPSQIERCDNDLDDDCDGDVDEVTDEDQDGFTNCQGDCDDGDGAIHPDAEEVCDGVDNDCDGGCDDGFDEDGDHYTSCGTKDLGGTCEDVEVDCDDSDGEVRPGFAEVCDGKDNDCSGACDEPFDGDDDGYTTCGSLTDRCVLAEALTDCKDTDPAIHPFADELCDGKDNDCDEQPAGPQPCYAVSGACQVGEAACDDDASDGPFGLAVCAPSGGDAVDGDLCTSYDACVAAEAPDPFTCANQANASTAFTCQVKVKLGDAAPTLCPGAEVALGALVADTGTCAWAVPGGTAHRHWEAGVAATSGATPDDALAACAGFFVVKESTDLVPQEETVYLLREDGGAFQTVRVDLAPTPVIACDGPALVCTPL